MIFSVEICILCWVKFYTFESHMAAWVATGLLIPIFFIFIAFAAHFYLKVAGLIVLMYISISFQLACWA